MLSIFFLVWCAIVDHSQAQININNHPNVQHLHNKHCARKKTSRIYGGGNAELGEFPFMAGLVYRMKNGSESRYACGGTILNKQTILTSAHCVTELPEEVNHLHVVRLGDWDEKINPDCVEEICAPGIQSIFLKEIIFHSGFNSTQMWNDIALIRLVDDIEFNSYVFPVCLLNGNLKTSAFVGDQAVLVRWGANTRKPKYGEIQESSILTRLALQVRDPNVCETEDKDNFFPEKQLCVEAGDHYNLGPCTRLYGDEGGPLLISRDFKNYLIGILSYNALSGENCTKPPVFVRVTAYMEWILDNIVESKKNFLSVPVFLCGDIEPCK